MLLAPLVEEAAIAESDELRWVDAEAGSGSIDPFGGTFEFGVIADGRLVDYAVAFAASPLRAPFFVSEGGDQPEREEDFGQSFAIGNLNFRFNAVLVRVLAGAFVRKPFMGERAVAREVADAKDFSARAHLAIGGVVQDVALEGARGNEREAGGVETRGEGENVFDAEFDFGFDGHGKE